MFSNSVYKPVTFTASSLYIFMSTESNHRPHGWFFSAGKCLRDGVCSIFYILQINCQFIIKYSVKNNCMKFALKYSPIRHHHTRTPLNFVPTWRSSILQGYGETSGTSPKKLGGKRSYRNMHTYWCSLFCDKAVYSNMTTRLNLHLAVDMMETINGRLWLKNFWNFVHSCRYESSSVLRDSIGLI